MGWGDPSGSGLVGSLRRLLETAVSLAQRRLELIALEAQEEKVRLLDLLFRVAVVVVLGWMALLTATATLVVAFWDTHPVIVLVVVTVLYGGMAAAMALGLRRRLRDGPRPFAGTIEEFRKDRECFGKRN
ncbi:MAG: phage holin family protein [Verrucomicrobia bacterium]|nr:phage holin family protein [Verrucomicrobiota bacterium]